MSFNAADSLRIIQQHVLRSYEGQAEVEAWRNLPEIPSSAEIIRLKALHAYAEGKLHHENVLGYEALDLVKNITDGPWNNVSQYVGNHYRLIREDAVGPLRDAVSLYRIQPSRCDGEDVAIYTDVHIVGMTCSTQGPAFRVEFSYKRARSRIAWKHSDRLRQGTIVALSPVSDGFRSFCKVAVVAARPLQGLERNPPQVDLFWGDANEAEFDPHTKYIMIEARTGYYEASRHMLVAMQKLITESFPLQEQLVGLRASTDAPEFIHRNPIKNLSSLSSVARQNAMQLTGADGEPRSLRNVNVLGKWPESNGTQLDQSQMDALQRIYTKRLAIIQGPPGTGKTFVSVSALKVMVDNWSPGDPPILVAAQTNHALDQLLTQVAIAEPNFIRLGGRVAEDNAVVGQRTLHRLRARIDQSSARANLRKCRKDRDFAAKLLTVEIEKAMTQGIGETAHFLEYGIITEDQYRSIGEEDWTYARDPKLTKDYGVIAHWLGRSQMMAAPRCSPTKDSIKFEALEELELEGGRKDEDDSETLIGPWCSYQDFFVGRHVRYSEDLSRRYLSSVSDLWAIPVDVRGEVYHFMRQQLKLKVLPRIRSQVVNYKRCVECLKIAQWQADAFVIVESKIKLIGCTTTGLSKYRGLLASLQPRTMLIEEAAETLEGTILAAMFDSLQQLILVGDHQQLQAKCNSSVLAQAPYNLGTSMFERLVANGFEYTMLNEQRRMIPEIRALLDPFYPNLQDHTSVLDRGMNRKPVPGMGGRNAYAFHHQWPESPDENSSKSNVEEAAMIAGFFHYLVWNGVHSSKITILTFYTGQKKMITRKLRLERGLESGGPFNVFTVDSYQGEENDIILLSLVRSNKDCRIGFLENKNRAVVSLSRARRGLYIFGNFHSLMRASQSSEELWGTVATNMLERGLLHIDRGFLIVCEKHGNEKAVQNPQEWEHFAGGCGDKCGEVFPCGHICPYSCHVSDHTDIICQIACSKRRYCGHRCTAKCGEPCRCACTSQTSEDLEDREIWCLEDLLNQCDSPGKSGSEAIPDDGGSQVLSPPPPSIGAGSRLGFPTEPAIEHAVVFDSRGRPGFLTEPAIEEIGGGGGSGVGVLTEPAIEEIEGRGEGRVGFLTEPAIEELGGLASPGAPEPVIEDFGGASPYISISSSVKDMPEDGSSQIRSILSLLGGIEDGGSPRLSTSSFEDEESGASIYLSFSSTGEDALKGSGGSQLSSSSVIENVLGGDDSPSLSISSFSQHIPGDGYRLRSSTHPPLQRDLAVLDSGAAGGEYTAQKWRDWSDLNAEMAEGRDAATTARVIQPARFITSETPSGVSSPQKDKGWKSHEEGLSEAKLSNLDSNARSAQGLSDAKDKASIKPQRAPMYMETHRSVRITDNVRVRQPEEDTTGHSGAAPFISQANALVRSLSSSGHALVETNAPQLPISPSFVRRPAPRPARYFPRTKSKSAETVQDPPGWESSMPIFSTASLQRDDSSHSMPNLGSERYPHSGNATVLEVKHNESFTSKSDGPGLGRLKRDLKDRGASSGRWPQTSLPPSPFSGSSVEEYLGSGAPERSSHLPRPTSSSLADAVDRALVCSEDSEQEDLIYF